LGIVLSRKKRMKGGSLRLRWREDKDHAIQLEGVVNDALIGLGICQWVATAADGNGLGLVYALNEAIGAGR
jgi:hypothetical protein